MVDEWQFCVIIDAIRSIVSSCTIHVHAGVNSNASFNMTMHKYSRLVVLSFLNTFQLIFQAFRHDIDIGMKRSPIKELILELYNDKKFLSHYLSFVSAI